MEEIPSSGMYNVEVLLSGPETGQTIAVHRRSDHYNGILPCVEPSTVVKSTVTALVYTSKELGEIGGIRVPRRPIKKKIRKRLFQLQIW